MSILAKLDLKSVTRTANGNPVEQRRKRLINKLNEQIEVFNALQKGKQYTQMKSVNVTDSDGNKAVSSIERTVKPWFFEQDSGWYIQCRYGSRLLNIYNRHNAVYVKKYSDIGIVLNQFIDATYAGEFDKVIASVLIKRK